MWPHYHAKKKKFKMGICEFADGATMHGFNHIFKKEQKTLRTVVWSLAFIGSVILFLLQVTQHIRFEIHNCDFSVHHACSIGSHHPTSPMSKRSRPLCLISRRWRYAIQTHCVSPRCVHIWPHAHINVDVLDDKERHVLDRRISRFYDSGPHPTGTNGKRIRTSTLYFIAS